MIGLEVGFVEVLDAVVDVPNATYHDLFRKEIGDGACGHCEKAEEEVHHILACFCIENFLGFVVYEKLQAQFGGGHVLRFVVYDLWVAGLLCSASE